MDRPGVLRIDLNRLTTRGFGAANEIQNRASSPALLEPGLNLVMLGYNEAGGGSGARIAMFSDSCFKTPFTEDEVSVTADNPEFGGDDGGTIHVHPLERPLPTLIEDANQIDHHIGAMNGRRHLGRIAYVHLPGNDLSNVAAGL